MKAEFISLLRRVDVDLIDIGLYQKKYLRHLIKNIDYYISIYEEIISKCIKQSERDKHEIVLIDYGCGNGLLGMYAKFIGIKEVYLIDMSKPSLDAALQLSEAINIKLDAVVCGEIDDLCKIDFSKNSVIIIGTDVIEHVYDLGVFFKKLSSIHNDVTTCFTTGSNPSNWFKVKQLNKFQYKDEHVGGDTEDKLLYGAESCVPFLEIRKKIILSHFPNISSIEVDKLGKATRGKNKADVIIETQNYIETNIMPIELPNKYNTCNPITGSWTERILEINDYKNVYQKNGFKFKIENGFYNSMSNTKLKNALLNVINLIIKGSHFIGKKISPFIVIYGSKSFQK